MSDIETNAKILIAQSSEKSQILSPSEPAATMHQTKPVQHVEASMSDVQGNDHGANHEQESSGASVGSNGEKVILARRGYPFDDPGTIILPFQHLVCTF